MKPLVVGVFTTKEGVDGRRLTGFVSRDLESLVRQGAVFDVANLADDKALVERVAAATLSTDGARAADPEDVALILRALAATLVDTEVAR